MQCLSLGQWQQGEPEGAVHQLLHMRQLLHMGEQGRKQAAEEKNDACGDKEVEKPMWRTRTRRAGHRNDGKDGV